MSQTDSPQPWEPTWAPYMLEDMAQRVVDYAIVKWHSDPVNIERLRLEKERKNKHNYVYALTINAGGISHNMEDCSQIVDKFNRVCATKQLKNCRITYVYEAYTKIDKEAPRTEDNLKRTFPHIHALIESYKPIHKGTMEKTTKCITQLKRQKFGHAKWSNYLKKDANHSPTMELYKPYLFDTPTYGVIHT